MRRSNNSKWVKIPNEFGGAIKNEDGEYTLLEISNEAVALYYNLVASAGCKDTTISNLGYLLSDFKFAVIKEQIPIYQKALGELLKLGYIELYDEEFEPIDDVTIIKKNTCFRYCISEVSEFFRADIDDVEILMDYMSANNMRARSNFIRYYMILQRRTNYIRIGSKGEVGNEIAQITGAQANEIIGISAKTYAEYNKILKELEIYHFSNHYVTRTIHKNVPTRVARCKYVSKEQFEYLVDKEMKDRRYIRTSKEVTRARISRGMKKHHSNKQNSEHMRQVKEQMERKDRFELQKAEACIDEQIKATEQVNINTTPMVLKTITKSPAFGVADEEKKLPEINSKAVKPPSRRYKHSGIIPVDDWSNTFNIDLNEVRERFKEDHQMLRYIAEVELSFKETGIGQDLDGKLWEYRQIV